MRKLVVVCITAAFAVLLCQTAFCQPDPGAAPVKKDLRAPGPQMEEARKMMERLRELNQQLREASAKARKSDEVRKAFEKVRELQGALSEAQKHANEVLEKAIVAENPDLAKAVKERRAIEEKLRELRGQFSERLMQSTRGDRPQPRPRVRPVEEQKP